MKTTRALLALIMLAAPAIGQAHEVWIERDGAGPARIYLGEPAQVLPPGGDPEFKNLKAPRLLSAPNAALVRQAGYIEVAAPEGDVRAWDDTVFNPWGPAGKKESVVYYARAGRSDPRAQMPLEIVPVAANADRFTLVRDGKPVQDATVTVVTPDKWSKTVVTDAQGLIDLPKREAGRYLLSAVLRDEGVHETPAGPVQVLHRIATITFVVPEN